MVSLRSRKGVTLVEVMVSAAILSMAGVALVAVLSQSVRGWSSSTSDDAAVNQATIGLQKLAKDMRDGRSATVVSGALVVSFPARITDATTGQVTYDPSSADPVVHRYYLSGTNLMRQIGDSTTVLAKGIASITFGVSGGNVSVTLTSADQIGTCSRQQTANSRVALRNFRT